MCEKEEGYLFPALYDVPRVSHHAKCACGSNITELLPGLRCSVVWWWVSLRLLMPTISFSAVISSGLQVSLCGVQVLIWSLCYAVLPAINSNAFLFIQQITIKSLPAKGQDQEESPCGWDISQPLVSLDRWASSSSHYFWFPGQCQALSESLMVPRGKEETREALDSPWVPKLVSWAGSVWERVGIGHRMLDMPSRLDLLQLESSEPQRGGGVTLTATASVTN